LREAQLLVILLMDGQAISAGCEDQYEYGYQTVTVMGNGEVKAKNWKISACRLTVT
jgi:hypothetical protein